MTATVEQISRLLHEAGETHHRVFRIVDGADDDWASWYADWLVNLSELAAMLGVKASTSNTPPTSPANPGKTITPSGSWTISARQDAERAVPRTHLKRYYEALCYAAVRAVSLHGNIMRCCACLLRSWCPGRRRRARCRLAFPMVCVGWERRGR